MADTSSATRGSESTDSDPFVVGAPSLTLPRGGGALRSIGETFAAQPSRGTASFSIPIAISPGRDGVQPSLALAYDSGAGNGAFGLGWSVAIPSIGRPRRR